MNRIFGGLWLVGAGCGLLIGACVGTSSEVGKLDDPDAGMMPGAAGTDGNGAICEVGQSKPAGDGCNTCTCTEDGEWACTLVDCQTCTPGEMAPAGDGCNTCSCTEDGNWACTEIGCVCKVGETKQSCDNTCTCVDDGNGPTWECKGFLADPAPGNCPQCTPGSTRISDDMCSTCTCDTSGQWSCPPAGTGCAPQECEEGAMKPASDGCNTCQCFHGTWGCTMKLCQPPLMCSAGTADCDADPANGCETKILNDVMNCGACGNYCALAGGTAICVDGKCELGSCMAGYADCDHDPTTGCEAPVGAAGCSTRCDPADDSLEVTPAEGDCKCPAGTACVRNSAKGKADLCFPLPEGCKDGLGTCSCLGSCVCDQPEGVSCTEQMAIGGVFNLDCAGIQ